MTELIKKTARRLLGKGVLYKYLRGRFVFNDLKSPRPLMVKPKLINIDWYKSLSDKGFVHPEKVKIACLISPMQRSGTNYLHHLLNLHADIAKLPEGQWPPEDFILSNSHELENYVTKTINLWSYWIKDDELLNKKANELFAGIGIGLAKVFEQSGRGITLLKTPDSLGIENYFKLFPDAKIIILTRDGRDTIESYMNSWGGGGNFNALAKRWNDRVEKILSFKRIAEKNNLGQKVLMVDYNELNLNTSEIVRGILEFLELDISKYDWENMKKTPVLGSSVLRGENNKVNWKPIAKPKNFNQDPKWKKWSASHKRRFKKYAGKSLVDLGYESNSIW